MFEAGFEARCIIEPGLRFVVRQRQVDHQGCEKYDAGDVFQTRLLAGLLSIAKGVAFGEQQTDGLAFNLSSFSDFISNIKGPAVIDFHPR